MPNLVHHGLLFLEYGYTPRASPILNSKFSIHNYPQACQYFLNTSVSVSLLVSTIRLELSTCMRKAPSEGTP